MTMEHSHGFRIANCMQRSAALVVHARRLLALAREEFVETGVDVSGRRWHATVLVHAVAIATRRRRRRRGTSESSSRSSSTSEWGG